jgi:DNA-binding transcriptional LysR family regulator
MNSARFLLPTVRNLIVFESAGRLLNFTAAAKELGMTQAAVSYAVSGLEQQLATPLFRREHRGVRLTEAGESFLADTSLALSLIQKSAMHLQSSSRTRPITIVAPPAFARFWLLPRVSSFRKRHADIHLRILPRGEEVDFVAEGLSIGVRLATPGTLSQYEHRALFPERIYAVCGEAYAKSHQLPALPEDFASQALVQPDDPMLESVSWNDWLESAGVYGLQLSPSLQTGDHALAMQAALDNLGLSLTCSSFAAGFLSAGQLVRVTDHVLITGRQFQLLWPRAGTLSRDERIVRDWLIEEAGEEA